MASEPQAFVRINADGSTTSTLWTAYTNSNDPSETAILFFINAGGRNFAFAATYANLVPSVGYVVADTGVIKQLLPPPQPTNTRSPYSVGPALASRTTHPSTLTDTSAAITIPISPGICLGGVPFACAIWATYKVVDCIANAATECAATLGELAFLGVVAPEVALYLKPYVLWENLHIAAYQKH